MSRRAGGAFEQPRRSAPRFFKSADSALESLLATQTLWHVGHAAAIAADGESTGVDVDVLLPQRAFTELLLTVGELLQLLSTLAHFTKAGGSHRSHRLGRRLVWT